MKKQKAPAVAGMIRKVGREIFCEDKVQELEFLIVKREGGGRAGTVRTDTCYPKDGLSHHSPASKGSPEQAQLLLPHMLFWVVFKAAASISSGSQMAQLVKRVFLRFLQDA